MRAEVGWSHVAGFPGCPAAGLVRGGGVICRRPLLELSGRDEDREDTARKTGSTGSGGPMNRQVATFWSNFLAVHLIRHVLAPRQPKLPPVHRMRPASAGSISYRQDPANLIGLPT